MPGARIQSLLGYAPLAVHHNLIAVPPPRAVNKLPQLLPRVKIGTLPPPHGLRCVLVAHLKVEVPHGQLRQVVVHASLHA